jgi:putative ABC transport system permease protein
VQAWVSQVGNIALITASILGAVFFTILLVTGNTMSQAVRERTGELGVLKAIGFTNPQVLALVLSESCLLAVLGGGLGLGVAWLLVARGDPTGGMLPLVALPTSDVLVGVALSVTLGVVTGIFPALQAMRLRVADALRRM